MPSALERDTVFQNCLYKTILRKDRLEQNGSWLLACKICRNSKAYGELSVYNYGLISFVQIKNSWPSSVLQCISFGDLVEGLVQHSMDCSAQCLSRLGDTTSCLFLIFGMGLYPCMKISISSLLALILYINIAINNQQRTILAVLNIDKFNYSVIQVGGFKQKHTGSEITWDLELEIS